MNMGYEDELAKVAPEKRSAFQMAAQLRNLLSDPDLQSADNADLVAQASRAVEADIAEKTGVAAAVVDVAAAMVPIAASEGVVKRA
jgi:hypothetical protein